MRIVAANMRVRCMCNMPLCEFGKALEVAASIRRLRRIRARFSIFANGRFWLSPRYEFDFNPVAAGPYSDRHAP